MKKILISALVAFGVAATVASANSLNGSGTYFGVGANQYSVNPTILSSDSENGFSGLIGVERVWSSNVITVSEFEYDQANILNNIANNFGANIKLGYKIQPIDTGVYVIGSAMYTSLDNINGGGFGYGAGIEYTPKQLKHFGVAFDYITYPSVSTKIVGLKYDLIITKAYLKYTF